jgi:SAM-dependent methyltransferase
MPKTEAFEQNTDLYEAWFDQHSAAYQSELTAVRTLWPSTSEGLEIGAGAGHFAAPLGIKDALEPSASMRRAASKRGVHAIEGTAERIPFPDGRFDAALMVTALCFVDDPSKSLQEMLRVLRPGGCAVIGFLDRLSPLGQEYESKREASVFYRNAHLFSTLEVSSLLTESGFERLDDCQTLFKNPYSMRVPDPVRVGFGEGSFVVVRGWKPEHRRVASV